MQQGYMRGNNTMGTSPLKYYQGPGNFDTSSLRNEYTHPSKDDAEIVEVGKRGQTVCGALRCVYPVVRCNFQVVVVEQVVTERALRSDNTIVKGCSGI